MSKPDCALGATRTLRVHVQRRPRSNKIFSISESDFHDALVRHPDVAPTIAVSFGRDYAELRSGVTRAEVLLTDNIDVRDLTTIAPRLKWVQTIQTGVERLLPLIPSDVTLTNARGIDAIKAGEFVIGAMIMLNVRLPLFIAQQRIAHWRAAYTGPLGGRTAVILGTGHLGQAIAAQARHFGMHVLGISRHGEPRPGFDSCATSSRLPEFLPCADFLIIALPSTPGTHMMIGRTELSLLPLTAAIVNVGRADVMDYEALAEKLSADELAGAILDVFSSEPLPPESPLWTVPNLLITPHCAIDDGVSYVPRVLDLFLDNVRRYLAGTPLRNVVDPALGY